LIISKTPLRASFFGGGTDFAKYYENSSLGFGAVISTTVDMNVYITVNRSFDGSIRLCYADNERVQHVNEVKHNLIREALKITGIEDSVEIIYSADLPLSTAGIGLASSSAISVGVLKALYAYQGIYAPPELLARKACEIERSRLGQRIGVQDQYAVAYGGFNLYYFNADGTVAVSPVVCPKPIRDELESNLLLFFTGISRDSKEILNEQEESISQKMEMLDSLVQAAEKAAAELSRGRVDEWGYMLNASWQTKKRFAKGISTPLIDTMYESAREAGALGGKVLGAGGGGFLLLYVPQVNQVSVRSALSEYREVPFSFAQQGSRIVFSD